VKYPNSAGYYCNLTNLLGVVVMMMMMMMVSKEGLGFIEVS
jgi:hypothetical protein